MIYPSLFSSHDREGSEDGFITFGRFRGLKVMFNRIPTGTSLFGNNNNNNNKPTFSLGGNTGGTSLFGNNNSTTNTFGSTNTGSLLFILIFYKHNLRVFILGLMQLIIKFLRCIRYIISSLRYYEIDPTLTYTITFMLGHNNMTLNK